MRFLLSRGKRTFTLQLYARPLRWLPHKHYCPKCKEDYWCKDRNLWNACPGHIKERQHEKTCNALSGPTWTTGARSAKDGADHIASMINAMSRRSKTPPSVVYMSPYMATDLGIEFTQELDGVSATVDDPIEDP